MNILVTGAKGFVGRNLVAALKNYREGRGNPLGLPPDFNIFEYDIDFAPSLLDNYCRDAGFVFHLAGVNRPAEQAEFMEGNAGFTAALLGTLKKHRNTCPVMISSSVQATLDTPYGRSKKAGEDLMRAYALETGAEILIYRFPNLFGRWCRPHYNSAVATFCHNLAHDIPIQVRDPGVVMKLAYIDDVAAALIQALCGQENKGPDGFCSLPVVHTITLGEVADLLISFRESRNMLSIPDLSDAFTKKLYATYLSYLPTDGFNYPLKMNVDDRGSFTEIFRTADRGQFSVNISKPGMTKGNHWHNTKQEKFAVVSGTGAIRLRNPDSDTVLEYFVSGDKAEVVDVPAGYIHHIENLGDTDLVILLWCSECFDPERPDTYFLEV